MIVKLSVKLYDIYQLFVNNFNFNFYQINETYICTEFNNINTFIMNYTIVGLFPSQENIQKVSAGLEKSGIRNEDYLTYKRIKNTARPQKKNFWEKLFGAATSNTNLDTDGLITSVEVRNEEDYKNVTASFKKNQVVKIYEFKDMTIEDAKDLGYIKKIVELRAKSQIYSMPATAIAGSAKDKILNTEF